MAATSGVNLNPPKRASDLGIPVGLVHDLVIRQALYDGRTSVTRLSEKLKLSPLLLTTVVEELRELRMIEIQGLDGRDYKLALTDGGRASAQDRITMCRYAGPAPVSLEDYYAVITSQKADVSMTIDDLKGAFSDLVINEDLLWEVGPSAIASGAMFLYGPPGTGKSSIAERLLRIYQDRVLVPYTVEVDGQIITVFDPVVHRPVDDQPSDLDPRWIVCERPSIIVGGELVGSMLDLQFQKNSGVYVAPLQMQANNGIFVIDDFGRQSLTPEQLLNRWIVPLDRQIDYLTLDYGLKFEIPFDAKIVFSTNLQPEVLGDEAFFRRIQSKILIPAIEDDQFDEILRRVAKAMKVEIAPGADEHLRMVSKTRGDGDLRPYLPVNVCKILKSLCNFAGLPVVLDNYMIDLVASVYFTKKKGAEQHKVVGLRELTDMARQAGRLLDLPTKAAPAPEPERVPMPGLMDDVPVPSFVAAAASHAEVSMAGSEPAPMPSAAHPRPSGAPSWAVAPDAPAAAPAAAPDQPVPAFAAAAPAVPAPPAFGHAAPPSAPAFGHAAPPSAPAFGAAAPPPPPPGPHN